MDLLDVVQVVVVAEAHLLEDLVAEDFLAVALLVAGHLEVAEVEDDSKCIVYHAEWVVIYDVYSLRTLG